MPSLTDVSSEVLRSVISYFPAGGTDWVNFSLALGRDKHESVASYNESWRVVLSNRYPQAAKFPMKHLKESVEGGLEPHTGDTTADYPWGTYLSKIQQIMYGTGVLSGIITKQEAHGVLGQPPGRTVDLRSFVASKDILAFAEDRKSVVSLVPKNDEKATYTTAEKVLHTLSHLALGEDAGMEEEETPLASLLHNSNSSSSAAMEVDLFVLGVDLDEIDPEDNGEVDRTGRAEAWEEKMAMKQVGRRLGDLIVQAITPTTNTHPTSTAFQHCRSTRELATTKYFHQEVSIGGARTQILIPSGESLARESGIRYLFHHGRELIKEGAGKPRDDGGERGGGGGGFFSKLFSSAKTVVKGGGDKKGAGKPMATVCNKECMVLVIRGEDALEASRRSTKGKQIETVAKSHFGDLLNHFKSSKPTTVNDLHSSRSKYDSQLCVVILWDKVSTDNNIRDNDTDEVEDVIAVGNWVVRDLLKEGCGLASTELMTAGDPDAGDSPAGFPFVQIRHVSTFSKHSILSLCRAIQSKH